jgi:hypothetical protein
MAHSPPRPIIDSITFELAETVLGQDLTDYLYDAKKSGVTWDDLFLDLRSRDIAISYQTMKKWTTRIVREKDAGAEGSDQ